MMLRLYDYLSSGNGYKVRLLLGQLGIPFERVELDIDRQETRTPDFLSKNPNGRIPTLELENGDFLWESNAILFYLADGTPYLSSDRLARAVSLQWMFFEQYSHEPYIAGSRYALQHLPATPEREGLLRERRPKGYDALRVMERHLRQQDFFVGGRYSIADIALFAYSHVADEGGFDLADFPAVRAWLDRVTAQPGHRRITDR
jgi:glutathione S-transferase